MEKKLISLEKLFNITLFYHLIIRSANSLPMKSKYLKRIFVMLIIASIFSTSLMINYNYIGYSDTLNLNAGINDNFLRSSANLNYTQILEEPNHGLGNITITDLSFDEEGFFNRSIRYPKLDTDIESGALNHTYISTKYVETTKVAVSDRFNYDFNGFSTILVLINDTISVQFNTSISDVQGFLIYGPRLYPCSLKGFYIQNQSSSIVQEVSEEDYNIDSSNFLVFNYKEYFNEIFHNFSMHIIWEYKVQVNFWKLSQVTEEIPIRNIEQSFVSTFNYTYFTIGEKFSGQTLSKTNAQNLEITVRCNPSEKEKLFDYGLFINGEEFNDDFVNPDNSIFHNSSGDITVIYFIFSANFTVRFNNPVGETWAVDRLINQRDIRERIYIPSLIDGPKELYVVNLSIIEDTIILGQVLKNHSLFGRTVNYFDANITLLQDILGRSLVFTQNSIKQQGLRIILPYLVLGETCPFMISYRATRNLRVVITDNIQMPISGLNIELFYFGLPYGTYISNDKIQPMAPISTDGAGEIIVRNVPNGNFTIRILQNQIPIMETIVSSYTDINHVNTTLLHFPLIIIILSIFFGLITLIGLAIYLKFRR